MMVIDKADEECEIWGMSLRRDLRAMQIDENQFNEYEGAHPEKREEVPGAIPRRQTRAVKRKIREHLGMNGSEQYDEAPEKAQENAKFCQGGRGTTTGY